MLRTRSGWWRVAAPAFCVFAAGITLHETIAEDHDNAVYPTAPPEDVKTAAASNNAFAIDLYAKLASQPGGRRKTRICRLLNCRMRETSFRW